MLLAGTGRTPVSAMLAVPDERAAAEIFRLSEALERVATIPDVKKVIAMAAAIDSATRSLAVSERIRRDAAILVVRAERRLGQLTAAIPKRLKWQGAKPDPNGPNKDKTIKEHALPRWRVRRAEGLAAATDQVFEKAIADSPRVTVGKIVDDVDPRQKRHHPLKGYHQIARDMLDKLNELRSARASPTFAECQAFADAIGRVDRQVYKP